MAVYEFPASTGQRWMWLLAELDPGEAVYNIAFALWLDGPVDLGALQGAWDAVIARHEALRTTFRNSSGVPLQVIDDEPPTEPVLVISVEDQPAEAREPAARTLIRDLARTPFDLAKGPLVRPLLVRLAPEQHVLTAVLHHIIADGWSFRILFDELSRDYEGIVHGGGIVVAEPPIQYADFALWQLEHAEEGGYAQAVRFWREALDGAPPALPLPADEPYPARQTFAAQGADAWIDDRLAEQLWQLAARLGTTRFAVLLAAYSLVLSRLTGRQDLLIAVPMAARTRPETESVVGMFTNTVVIRMRIDQDWTLADLVRSAHSATMQALAHQELPTPRIVELANPERDPARMALVQAMFSMEEPWAVPDRGGLRWRPEIVEKDTAMFEFELTVTGPKARLNYNSALFHPATGQLVTGGFIAVLRQLAVAPDQLVADVEIMSPGEAELVTRVWPGPDKTVVSHTAVELLRAACAGDRVVAADTTGTELTGDSVREAAERITAALRGQGVTVGDRVGILVPRSARLLPAILGVWDAGASYIPMDPIYPPQRLAAMLADAGAAAIIVDSGAPGAPGLPTAAPAIPVVDLTALPPGSGAPVVDPPPSATAVTIFTSGSTGRPKAVSVTQGGIAALLTAVRPLLALDGADRLVAVTTFAFDIALVELLAPVLAGGRVIVASAEDARDARRLRELLIETRATAMQATPAGWRMLVDAGGIPDGVRLRMTAGEPLPRDLADILCAGAGARVRNLYGPTETTIYSGGDAVAPSPAPVEIGPVIAGTRLYVLDDRMRPVPPGVFGEVHIGGAGVAHGYHGAPGMTAARFVPDPFSQRSGARLYRTGDIGRWRRSGRIELAGRADRQLKIRGYRVESGEVEAALRADEDVEQAAVSVRRGAQDGQDGQDVQDVRLVGYLVTRSGAVPAGLSDRLRETLPDYMVPAAFVVLPELPLTGSGKIDYRALPEPDWGAGAARLKPRTRVESRLAELIAELLALPDPVGVTDNFFALGGHSLTATKLMARIRDLFGVDLPVRTLFSDPTVAGLAAALARK